MKERLDKVRTKFESPVFTTKVHKYVTFVWVLLIIPTLIWWKESILWVALMSIWANIVGHWSAYQASRAEEASTSDILSAEEQSTSELKTQIRS